MNMVLVFELLLIIAALFPLGLIVAGKKLREKSEQNWAGVEEPRHEWPQDLMYYLWLGWFALLALIFPNQRLHRLLANHFRDRPLWLTSLREELAWVVTRRRHWRA